MGAAASKAGARVAAAAEATTTAAAPPPQPAPITRRRRAAKARLPMSDRPRFHVAPKEGWINDPNGPMWAGNTAHLFFQHVPNSAEWRWGLEWAGCSSSDLATWRRHTKPALTPGPEGSLDQDGCFSGCAHASGVLMYTGVVRRSREEVEADEARYGPGAPGQRETQLIAVGGGGEGGGEGEGGASSWRKRPQPPNEGGDGEGGFLPRPPSSLGPLTCWRDPFLVHHHDSDEKGDDENDDALPRWLLVGSGLRQKAGTATVYRRRRTKGCDDGAAAPSGNGPALARGWEYHGLLATDPSCTIWECPMLLALPPHPEDEDGRGGGGERGEGAAAAKKDKPMKTTWLLSASPDYCANVSEYWLGSFDAEKTGVFVPQGAEAQEEEGEKGGGDAADGGNGANADKPPPPPSPPCLGLFPPALLDLGDILYAPNVLLPPPTAAASDSSSSSVSGRSAPVMWAWAQERGRPELGGGGGGGAEDEGGEGGGDGDGNKSNNNKKRTYSCCLTAPRVLYARPSPSGQPGHMRLWQEPLPELASLRVPGDGGGGAWPAPLVACAGDADAAALPLPRCAAAHADVELTLRLLPGCTGFALLLRPLSASAASSSSPSQGLALTYDAKSNAFAAVHGGAWRAPKRSLAALAALPAPKPRRVLHPPTPKEGGIEAARDQELASRAAAEAEEDGAAAVATATAAGAAEGGGGGEGGAWRRTGGTLDLPPGASRELSLRLLLDGSLVEVFCLSSGQALATRCYRCGFDEAEEDEGGEGERGRGEEEGGGDGGEDADADPERAPLALYAFGPSGGVEVVRGESHAMRSCFFEDEDEEEEEEEDADWVRVEAPPQAEEGGGAVAGAVAGAGATATLSVGGGGGGGGAADKAR